MKKEYLYEKIYTEFKNEILCGKYKLGEQIPTEKEIIQRYSVSRLTAKNAINLLAEEGLVSRMPGKGTFVSLDVLNIVNVSKRTVGLIFSGFSDSFGTTLLKELIHQLENNNINVLFKFSSESQEKETAAINELIRLNVDALVILPVEAEFHNPTLLKISLSNLPVVLVDRYLNGIDLPYVGSDNVQAAYQGIATLIEHGHQHISILYSSKIDNSSIQNRLKGIDQSFSDHQMIPNTNLWITDFKTNYNSIFENSLLKKDIKTITNHINEHPEITAFFALDYLCSELLLLSLESLNQIIPDNFSLIGFDGPLISSALPKFSRIIQNEIKIAINVSKIIVERLANKNDTAKNKLLIPTAYIDLGSVRQL